LSVQDNRFDRDFILAGKEELTKEVLVERFSLHYSKMSKTAIEKAVDKVFRCIRDDFYRDVDSFFEISDFNFRYNDIKLDSDNKPFQWVFENIEKKKLRYFYYGTLILEYSWVYSMEIDDEDIDFHMLRYVHE